MRAGTSSSSHGDLLFWPTRYAGGRRRRMCRRSWRMPASMTSGRGARRRRRLYSKSPMLLRDDYRRLLRRGGFAVWAAVGLPVLALQLLDSPRGRDPSRSARGSRPCFSSASPSPGPRPAAPPSRPGRSPAARRRPGGRRAFARRPAAVLRPGGRAPGSRRDPARGPLPPRAAPPPGSARRAPLLLALMWLHWGWHWGVVLAVRVLSPSSSSPTRRRACSPKRPAARAVSRPPTPSSRRRGSCSRRARGWPSARRSRGTSTTCWATT